MKRKNKYQKLFNSDAFFGTIFVFLTIYIFSVIFSADMFTPLKRVFEDFAITDINTDLKEENFISPDTNIVLINNSKLSLDETIELIAKLNDFNPKVIGLEDLDYTALTPLLLSKLDSMIFLIGKKLVIGYTLFDFENKNFISFYDSLKSGFFERNKDKFAYNDLDFQKDKRFYTQREFYPTIKVDTGIIKSFSYKIAHHYGSEYLKNRISYGYNKELINYRGNFNKFFFFEGFDLLNDDDPINRFENKIILIGNCPVFEPAKKLDELYFTPLNQYYSGRTFPDMFKTVILANIINMLVQGSFYDTIPVIVIIMLTFFITYLNFLLFLKVTKFKKELYELVSIFSFLIQSTLIMLLTYYFYYTFNLDLNLTLALIAIATTVFIFEAYIDSVKPFIIFIYNIAKKFFKNIFETKQSLMDI